jgi:2-polyprenyl-3-methyl-5-hydroxy-6-metoxy-1,4-benzoquinol methylase
MEDQTTQNCLLCGATAKTVYFKHPGYKQPDVYNIVHCTACNTSWANPLLVNQQIYDDIYSNKSLIPGYNRYFKYANTVLQTPDPLGYLAETEDVYWAIETYLNEVVTKELMILEVGSGLGYLVYALNQRGWKAKGIDISQVAVDQARALYGDHFVRDSIEEYSKYVYSTYDVVILTEVIEHIPNITEWLHSIDVLLKPGGEIIITTPNKSFYPSHSLWHTAPPPVHLWWLSETSFVYLAQRFNYTLRFIDFTIYNQTHHLPTMIVSNLSIPTRQSVLDSNGNVIPQGNMTKRWLKTALNQVNLLAYAKKVRNMGLKTLYNLQTPPHKPAGHQRDKLCAVLTKRL